MDFSTIADMLIGWVVAIGSTVNDLPGTVAFALGLFTWFSVELVFRRMVAGLRWVVLLGVLAGLGVSLPYVASLMFERGGDVPEIEAIETPSG